MTKCPNCDKELKKTKGKKKFAVQLDDCEKETEYEKEIEDLAIKINSYIKSKESVRISDLVIHFNKNAGKILKAIILLKERGEIEELNQDKKKNE